MNRNWNRRRQPRTKAYIRLGNVSFAVRKTERLRDALIRTHRDLGATLAEAKSRAGQTLGREVEDMLRRLMIHQVGSANVAWLNATGAQPQGDFITNGALVEVKSTFSDNGQIAFNMEPAEVSGHRHLAGDLGTHRELSLLVIFHRDNTFHLLSASTFGYHNPRTMRVIGHYCASCQKGRQKWKSCTHTTGDRLEEVVSGV